MEYEINSIYDIAEWFLHTMPMTHKKLQKLLYLSYGIYLVQNNEINNINNALFENNFEAWVHGPVDPLIYSMFKNNGINLLYREDIETFDFNQRVINALNTTLSIYGEYSADELENITHKQLPWQKARQGLSEIASSNNHLDDVDIYITFEEVLNYANN